MIQALLMVARWLALAHHRWRERIARRRPLAAEVDALHEKIEKLRADLDLLRARLLRMESRRRPHFAPWQRLAILWHAARYGLSIEATARAFVVSVQTVVNWRREVGRGVARLVQARPPLNRLPDLVEEITRCLKRHWPQSGTRKIAGILARLGIKASRTSVQRILRRGPRRPGRIAAAVRVRRGSLAAKRPSHIWLVDFTRLRSPFRSVVVGAVVDMFSRKVLAIRVCPSEPDAAFAVQLLREAIDAHVKVRWIVTDQGTQFTSRRFARYLRRRRIRRRFGAVGRTNSMATIERFWRSMKAEFARGLFLYRPIRAIERQLRAYAEWHNSERPHQGLGGRTPDEVHFGRKQKRPRLIRQARLEVRYLQGDRSFPILRLRRAARAAIALCRLRPPVVVIPDDPLCSQPRLAHTLPPCTTPTATPRRPASTPSGAGPLQVFTSAESISTPVIFVSF